VHPKARELSARHGGSSRRGLAPGASVMDSTTLIIILLIILLLGGGGWYGRGRWY
jgi:hypothetical protein